MKEAEDLRQHLKEKLSSLVARIQSDVSIRESVSVEQLATLTKLVVRDRQYLRQIELEQPIIVVVLTGTKTIYFSDRQYLFCPGELFLIPPATTIDVINHPDERCHVYTALVLELSSSLMEKIKLIYPEQIKDNRDRQPDTRFDIPLSPQLAESFIYLVQSIVNNIEKDSSYLNGHHVIEVILLLLESELRSQMLELIYPDFLSREVNLLRQDLSLPWSTTKLARELNISVSTLKRKLSKHDVSFSQVLLAERMNKAMQLLQLNQYNITEVASACGYESSSHFAVRFRQHHNLNPSEVGLKK